MRRTLCFVRCCVLVAEPHLAQKTLPVVSYQHSAVFTRAVMPSRPEEPEETRIVAVRRGAFLCDVKNQKNFFDSRR
ncbi:MAG: hypothetical protein F8N36_05230 [Desulfovibrio sp.]|uniref:hypothetical protein n=1 Tax=Desulfovibrio sp. TaxID=885 RepID=UPI00135E242E|nr:hypothetical protein [Desulfovibrio sp.]MTJ92251.1 hypothetical protein [Desulfovibrio sp.]